MEENICKGVGKDKFYLLVFCVIRVITVNVEKIFLSLGLMFQCFDCNRRVEFQLFIIYLVNSFGGQEVYVFGLVFVLYLYNFFVILFYG